MAGQSYIITLACDGALEQIEKYAPAEYAKLTADPAKKKELVQAARDTAIEYVILANELAGEPQDIAQRLAKHLSGDRIRLIEGGLSIPTFCMDITKKEDGKYWVELTREGESFAPARALTSADDIEWAIIMQYASILVEAVLLVLSAVGISVSPSGSLISRVVKIVFKEITTSAVMKAMIQSFIAAWTAAGNSVMAKAKAIFQFIKDIFSTGLLWTTIKSLCSEMEWFDWLKTAAKVTALIIASFATGGVALIAKIALMIPSAATFATKIVNVAQLSTIKETL